MIKIILIQKSFLICNPALKLRLRLRLLRRITLSKLGQFSLRIINRFGFFGQYTLDVVFHPLPGGLLFVFLFTVPVNLAVYVLLKPCPTEIGYGAFICCTTFIDQINRNACSASHQDWRPELP